MASHGAQAPPSLLHTTQKHPWLTADRGWVVAGQLVVGEPVQLLDGQTATVLAVQPVAGERDMYDLAVSAVHDFTIGSLQIVVHNCNYRKLARMNNIAPGDAPHHIIPCASKGHNLVQAAGADIDGAGNGIGLSRDPVIAASRNQPSHPLVWQTGGYHRRYNTLVNQWLDAAYVPGMSQQQAQTAYAGVQQKALRYIHLSGVLRRGLPLGQ